MKFYFNFQDLISEIDIKPSIEESEVEGCEVWGEKILGWCFYVNEIGKEMPITFLIFVSEDEKIYYVEVVKYRETRGGEIRSKIFLNQFKGKTLSEKIVVGENIKNIRGATLSAWATVRAVKKALGITKLIKNGKVKKIQLDEERTETPDYISRSFWVGDNFLTIIGRYSVDKVEEFLSNISKEFSDFYFYGIEGKRVRMLISKYSRKVDGFDIFWNGGKADLGAVWKGFVVDELRRFLGNVLGNVVYISFDSTRYFSSGEAYIFGRKFYLKDMSVSISSSDGEYSKIFDAKNGRFVETGRGVAVFHKSAEFSDFASTYCVIEGKRCEKLVKSMGGNVIWK